MPRVTHTAVAASGPNPTAGVAVTVTAADAANFEQTTLTGKEIILARNSGAVTRTITITSVADERGRVGHITTENITAGQVRVYGPFDPTAWKQTNGYLYFEASHAEVLFSVIRLP